ncbi:unnamed protein product [Moneuplotes crassus]|uniref:Uncharacterized protein n=1 Tax=Euplotes crassus TaxID=5936 RepID=A0AAD1UC82_EUPCR|nr:unnamed protein product [Moneuplotes crassus]
MTIVRAHQVQVDGYKMHRWDGPSSFPYIIAIFSAPNNCDYYSNKGSVLTLEEGNVSINVNDEVSLHQVARGCISRCRRIQNSNCQ